MKKNGLLIIMCLAIISFASAQQPQTRALLKNRGQSKEIPKKQDFSSGLTKKLAANQDNEIQRKQNNNEYSGTLNTTSPIYTPIISTGVKGLTDMVYAYNESDDHYTGQLGTPGTMTPLPTAYPNEVQAGEYINSVLYIADYNSTTGGNRFGTVNTTTGAFTQIGTTGPDAWGMAWNPITNKTYVSVWATSGPLYEIDIATGATTLVGNTGSNRTIAIDNDGVCYAITLGNPGSFGTINLTTGAYTEICPIPFHVNFVQNLSIDRTTNELYWSAREGTGTSTGSTGLYQIDKTTGNRTLMGNFATDFHCASFTILTNYVVNEDVPEAPTAFTATPESSGALSCELSWTNPTMTLGGTPLSDLTYIVITRDGTPIDSIENPTVGNPESYSDLTPTNGNHVYEVYAVNGNGDGAHASTSVFVGIDVAVVSIEQPVSAPNLTATETVQVIVKNNGFYPISSIPITLEVGGTIVTTETITTPIASSTTYTHTFTATADLSTVETHAIKVYTSLPGDLEISNDTLVKEVINYGNLVIMGSVPSVTSCNIRFVDNGVDEDYIPDNDQIITFYPATAGDMVSITFNELSTTIDPWLGADYSDFLFVINGAFTMDNLGDVTNEDILGGFYGDYTGQLPDPIIAENQDGALTVYFSLNNYFGAPSSGWDADITCVPVYAIDAAVKSVVAPVQGDLTASETITVTVTNKGSGALSNIPVVCEINGTALPTATIAGPLASFESTTQTFTADFSTLGNYTIVVYTDMTGDENHANDTVVTSTASLPDAAITWDFEQGMPSNFTLRVLDNGVANSATLFPNNEAWAIFTGDDGLAPIGMQCAISQSWFSSGTGAANRWMITPKVELGDPTMLQWDASCYEAEYPDGYTIKLSTTTNETASFTHTLYTIAAENHGWTNRVVDLSAYTGQQVYIAFIQNSNDQNIIAIDNIKLLGEATEVNTGIITLPHSTISIYPNPATDNLTIQNAAGTQARIYDISGKLLLDTQVQDNSQTININPLASGIYFLEVQGQQGKVTQKFIKQ